TPSARLKIADGFRVELVHSVPLDDRGSWVALTVDPKGRLIASDQTGYLYRITPAPDGVDPRASFVERLRTRIGMAQGMTFVGDRLYVMVNGKGFGGLDSGLYCLTDEDHNDQFETIRILRKIPGEGEHGPHAVIPAPDGKSLYLVCGNHTPLTAITASRVPRIWGEDQLVPRLWDAGGHAVGILAPGGWICRTDLDGRRWDLVSIGMRNCYDIAFNDEGELFTFDSDMEWDLGAPWYRPTRICHVTSGSEFGWRSGSGKWPVYSPDSLPPVCELGPGSPTGITFGRGTKFPDKYRQALFACDWSFGRLYAIHLHPSGASYRADVEEFLTGSPLPLTDVVVNPRDGALYFVVGGRQTKSGLY
ncbi:MAG TPA: heme-binding protein, partial [Pirellulaceae bacterium]